MGPSFQRHHQWISRLVEVARASLLSTGSNCRVYSVHSSPLHILHLISLFYFALCIHQLLLSIPSSLPPVLLPFLPSSAPPTSSAPPPPPSSAPLPPLLPLRNPSACSCFVTRQMYLLSLLSPWTPLFANCNKVSYSVYSRGAGSVEKQGIRACPSMTPLIQHSLTHTPHMYTHTRTHACTHTPQPVASWARRLRQGDCLPKPRLVCVHWGVKE